MALVLLLPDAVDAHHIEDRGRAERAARKEGARGSIPHEEQQLSRPTPALAHASSSLLWAATIKGNYNKSGIRRNWPAREEGGGSRHEQRQLARE